VTLKLVHSNRANLQQDTTNVECHLDGSDFEVNYKDSFSLQTRALNIAGNVIAIIGHNGAGKSTLIKSILGLLPIAHGTLKASLMVQKEIRYLTPEKDMAFCPENGSVFSDISVESYVKLWCRLKHNDANFYKKAGSVYCDLLKITPLLPKLGRELSKGQRRRVQTAIGFLTNPKLFLFDEPFEGLDVEKSHALTETINDHRSKMAFIISSHRMDVIERLADAVVVLHEGRIISTGSVSTVCEEIAGQSITLHCESHDDELLSLIREKFANCLVVRIENDITVTGKGLDVRTLTNFLNEKRRENILSQATRPTLIDAMNYHLRTFR